MRRYTNLRLPLPLPRKSQNSQISVKETRRKFNAHCIYQIVWRGGVAVKASDLQPIGRTFKSRPFRFAYNPGQVVHTHVSLFTKQYKLVPAQEAGS